MTGPAVRVQAVPSEFEIGAWGHRFFESDHDYSIADELTKDSGFSDYSDSDEKRQWFERPKIPAKVHEYMSEGGLTKVFTVYRNMLSNYTLLDLKCPQLHGALLDSPRYYLLCLGLLAIEHGWSLDDEFIVWLKANYASMYLNKERELQAKMILGEFRNGMPCRLGDVGLNDMEMEVLMMSKEDLRARGTVRPDGTFPGVSVFNTTCIRSKARMRHDNRTAIFLGGTTDTAVDTIRFTQNGYRDSRPTVRKRATGDSIESSAHTANGTIPADTWREGLRKQNMPRPRLYYTMNSPLAIGWSTKETGSQTSSLRSSYDNDGPVWTDGTEDEPVETEHGIGARLNRQWHVAEVSCMRWWHTIMYPLRITLDNFDDNPYSLSGWVYFLLATCLVAQVVLQAIRNIVEPPQTYMDVSKELPLQPVAPFTLFLFPPLFIRASRRQVETPADQDSES